MPSIGSWRGRSWLEGDTQPQGWGDFRSFSQPCRLLCSGSAGLFGPACARPAEFSGSSEARGLLTALTDAFNTNLDPVLQSLNVTDACMTISPYTTCSNPIEWLFWAPIAGVTVAFGWSRRLRRRIKRG
jgi:hypothetical protein